MEAIETLSNKIEDELEDACSYIDLALDVRDTDQASAEMYYQLSLDEMGHMEKLHKRVVDIIAEYRKENGDPSPDMQWRYNYIHKKHTDKAVQIKAKQLIYKEK